MAPEPAGPGRAAGEPADDVALWSRVAEAGIRTLRVPTPFQVGRVNCYLLEDQPLTLIDTGPNSGKALDELARHLRAVGHRLEEIELVIITHQHLDHHGLVDIVATRSGAEVAAIDILAPYVENFRDEAERDDANAAALMRRHGIAEDVVAALRQVTASFRAWGAKATVTRPLHDGETMQLRDRSLEVQLRPGHSPSDTLFWDEARRILIGGDHLIKHISSNPLLSRPLDGSRERPQALVNYLRSLKLTRELPAQVVLAGHGEPIGDHVALIDERLALHQRRARKLYGLIAERPQTAHDLAQALWGDVAVTQAFLTLSEVIGHIDLLANAGYVRETERDGVVLFEATGSTSKDDLGDLIPGGNPAESAG